MKAYLESISPLASIVEVPTWQSCLSEELYRAPGRECQDMPVGAPPASPSVSCWPCSPCSPCPCTKFTGSLTERSRTESRMTVRRMTERRMTESRMTEHRITERRMIHHRKIEDTVEWLKGRVILHRMTEDWMWPYVQYNDPIMNVTPHRMT